MLDLVSQDTSRESSRNVVFAAPADDPRARRPTDVVIVIATTLVSVIAAWTHAGPSDLDLRVSEFFADGLPGWLSALLTIVYILGGVYAFGLLVAIWVFGDGRGAVARDMGLAAALAAVASMLLALLAGPEWVDVLPELFERDGTPSYPVLRLALAVAVTRVASPYLSLPMRNVGRRLIFPMAIAAIILNYSTISGVVGAFMVGYGSAAAIHLIFGSGVGIPSKARIAAIFSELDLDPDDLSYLEVQPIGATLVRVEQAERPDLFIKVYGRDAVDAALVARAWRATWYRDADDTLTASGTQQVEHESLMLHEAADRDVPAPVLAGWARGPAGDAAIATEWLDGPRLEQLTPDDVDDDVLAQCWIALMKLHDANIAHRAIDGYHLVVTDRGIVIDDFSKSIPSPDPLAQAADIAQMLVATALAADNQRAIQAARQAIGDERLISALQVLQRSALSGELQRQVKRSKLNLKGLRSDVVDALDAEPPKLVELRRVTWGNVAMLALTLLAAYALISALGDIGLDVIVEELSSAIWAWVLVALVLAQLTNIGEYISLSGMVDRHVPFGPTIMFRYAISFISLAVPSEAGAIAMNVRYMQKLGVPTAAAFAQGPLLTVFSKGFDVILIVISAQVVSQSIDLDDLDAGPVLRILVLAGVLVLIGIVVTFSVKKLRDMVLPPLKEAFSAVKDSITDPERLLRVAGGSLLNKMLFALTLSASVSAYGDSISFAEALFVNSFVSLFVGFMPVPGGIGVAEAGLTAGLVAVGVPEETALAAAITHRIVTAYLPPCYGWYTTKWLTERDYL
ncbi:MAG: lysylphosphatidylglycerol synthase domain-containing protein [Acidimicrobiales bacterium]